MGTRLAEETDVRPKPMVEIGGYPILWHIMMHYWAYGFRQFAIALGYKGDYIKKYMLEYASLNGDLLIRTGNASGQALLRRGPQPDWEVELVETGAKTLTGGRIKRLGALLGGETFCLTWGDGVSDVNLARLIDFHRSHGRLATVTAVRPPARFGHMLFDGDRVVEFQEKPQTSEGWINGAFFVLEPEVLDFIDGDDTMWEHEPMRRLAEAGELMAYRHDGFWACMDTIRDKRLLNELWQTGKAPWKTWKD
jgi:glucose-1-phosphate cytidylyltransferase